MTNTVAMIITVAMTVNIKGLKIKIEEILIVAQIKPFLCAQRCLELWLCEKFDRGENQQKDDGFVFFCLVIQVRAVRNIDAGEELQV